jgi:trimeric autotransporter adhesin
VSVYQHRGTAFMAALAVIVGGVVVSLTTPATAVEPIALGSESYAAAGSCWEIKQQDPSAEDGAYWLLTSKMAAPQRFYCDMTTDGGGWVLVGKGRNGWTEDQRGTGSESQLTTTSFDGFQSTHQLPAERIDQLLDGGAVAHLADPIRLRRATNTAGSAWQEVRFKTSIVGEGLWTWSFGGGLPLQWFGFDGSQTNTTSRTANFGNDTSFLRVDTRRDDRTGWDLGFAYGTGVTGTTAPDSYLHDVGDPGSALPFTLMYLRPRVTSGSGFSEIPDTGTAALERRLLPRSDVDPMPWGVTGIAGPVPREGSVEVQALVESNGRMYVGGNFRWVQRDASGTGRVEQPFLAAFDVNTGEWVSSFRPQLDNQVRALEVLPSGAIVAGGEFSAVNGQPATAIVALDPITGATASSFDLTIENRLTSGVLRVESLSVSGQDLFLGGSFTHLRGGGRTWFAYMRNAARVSAVDGTTNTGWNPDFDGTVLSVDAAADPTRMYASGFFGASQGTPTRRAAAVQTVEGAPLAEPLWEPVWSNSRDYQRAIRAQGERVWVGGSEHNLFSFSTTTFERDHTTIMDPKGDLQAIEIDPTGVTFGGCHCNSFSYEGAANWRNPVGWFAVYSMGWMGAWDNLTGERLTDFVPRMTTRLGSGVWAFEMDSNGRLWAGGDMISARSTAGPGTWTGAFVRFSPSDATAPATPSGFEVTDSECRVGDVVMERCV